MAAVRLWLKQARHAAYRWLMKGARLAHLVLSMVGLMVLLFFGVTGLILNHPEWFDHNTAHREEIKDQRLPPELLSEPLDKPRVVEHLRGVYGITIPLHQGDEPVKDPSRGFEVDRDQNVIRVHFRAPGREVHVTIVHKDEKAPDDEPPPPAGEEAKR